jgi:hypothetical protein
MRGGISRRINPLAAEVFSVNQGTFIKLEKE